MDSEITDPIGRTEVLTLSADRRVLSSTSPTLRQGALPFVLDQALAEACDAVLVDGVRRRIRVEADEWFVLPLTGAGEARLQLVLQQGRGRTRAQRDKLALAQRASGLALFSEDLRSGQLDWDERMYALTGVTEPLPVVDWLASLVVRSGERGVQHWRDALKRVGPVGPTLFRLVRRGLDDEWVLASASVTADTSGRPAVLVGGLLDVTEQQRMVEDLRRAQRLEAVAHLTAGVAHNFNNMLMIVRPCVKELVSVAPVSHEQVGHDALDAVERAAEIVARLMQFAGQGTRGQEVVDAEQLCADTVRLTRRSFPAFVELRAHLDTRMGIRLAPGAGEQVLSNLLVNARDALLEARVEAPQVELRARDLTLGDESWVEIVVSDNGPGIPESLRTRIFEPFFTTKGAKGTGLGLASSQTLVSEHGGQLAVRPRVGGGTDFMVLLPSVPLPSLTPSRPAPLPRSGGAPLKVLMVEDELPIARVVQRGLRARGVEIEAVHSGAGLVRVLGQGFEANVVLLDLTLGTEDGRDLAPTVRTHLPDARLLFFTGQPLEPADAALADGVVRKPIGVDELLATLAS